MTRSSFTKEERYIIAAYEQLMLLGDETAELNRYAIGELAGMKERGVNASFKLFWRSNFVRPCDDVNFQMTSHGIALAKKLLERETG